MRDKPPVGMNRRPRAFFGRRKGHRLHSGQRRLVESLLPRLRIDPEAGPHTAATVFGSDRPMLLEIGFGGGEHLAARAADNPEAGFVGCEPYLGGIGKLLARIDRDGLSNIRLHDDDALDLLGALAPASLDGIFLLYPDPWPKARHHKRRFVSPLTLDALARVMKPGAEWRFATDIPDYADWTLAHLVRDPRFAWRPATPGAWRQPWADHVATRYEQKARRAGHAPAWFSFVRT